MIEARNLRKQFGKVVAVRDVSFLAKDGAVTALLGPNGAGKTTTLRMITGLMRPDGGRLRIDGIDVAAEPARARARLGVLPESRGLYERLTAGEHVRYFARLHGLARDEADERCEELMETLEMEDIADRRTTGFSHGERTKVALARALVSKPRNVLLDEPSSGLDVMSARTIRRLIRRLRDEGTCVIFSSHVMHEVDELCDQIAIISAGVVVANGRPDELRSATGMKSLEDVFVVLTQPGGEAP